MQRSGVRSSSAHHFPTLLTVEEKGVYPAYTCAHLEIVTGLLAEAERHFWCEDIVLYLDRMNIQRDARNTSAREIRLQELHNARGRRLVMLLIAIDPSELPLREDIITAAERYLV